MEHNLLCKPEANLKDIKYVRSHAQAIGQCQDIINKKHFLIGHGDGINNFSSGGSDNIRIGKRTAYIHTDNDSASFSTGSDERWKKNIVN